MTEIFEILLVILATLMTVGVTFAEYRRTNDILTPLHLAWGFFGFFYLLSFLHLDYLGQDAYLHPFSSPQTTTVTALFHLFTATVALTLGYYSTLGSRLGDITVQQLPESDLSPRTGRRLGIALFTAGLAATAIFVWKNGGPVELLAARNVFVFRTAPNSLRYWLALQIGLFAGLSLYLSAARFDDCHRLAYLLCSFLAGLFFIMHTRTRAIFAVVLLGLYAWYADDRVTVSGLIGLGIVSLAGFAVFRPIEMILQGESLSSAIRLLHYYIFVKTGSAFLYTDYFQGYMTLVEGVPKRIPFQWGRTFIGVPWLPFEIFTKMRIVASDPMRITELAVYGYDRPDTATAANGFGVLYMNFTLYGLLLGAVIYGVLFRLAYTIWRQAQSSVFLGALYFVVMYYFYMMMSGGIIVYNILIVLLTLRSMWFVVNVIPTSNLITAQNQSKINTTLGWVCSHWYWEYRPQEIFDLAREKLESNNTLINIAAAWKNSFIKQLLEYIKSIDK